MEDTHWVDGENILSGCGTDVLILVLMEDTHWVNAAGGLRSIMQIVLILVLMEDTHWGHTKPKTKPKLTS